MLIGEYSLALGEKNRIALPKKLREELNGNLIITKGYDGCVIVLDKTLWGKLIESIGQSSLFRMNARDTRRYLLGGATEIELDKQGRFVVPEYILNHSEIENEAIFLGVGEWVEIWSKRRWERKSSELAENAGDIAERLVKENE